MKNKLGSQTLVIGIIVLFVGAGIVSGVNENVEKVSIGTKNGAKDTLDINDGLVGYWSFDFETAEDESGNTNHGTVHGAVSVDGKSGKALNFDGVNDYVGLGIDTFNSLTSGTVSAWIKLDTLSPHQPIFAGSKTAVHDDYFTFGEYDFGKLVGFVKSGDIVRWKFITDSAVLSSGDWYFVTLVQDGITPKIYVNGHEVSASFEDEQDKTQWFDDLQGTISWWIGYRHTAVYNYYLNGIIDEVRLYDRALNEDEIQELYNNPAGLKTKLMFGRIANLNADAGNLMIFEALNLRCIQFSPFEFKKYTSGEKVKISEDYKGLLTPSFAFGIFEANI